MSPTTRGWVHCAEIPGIYPCALHQVSVRGALFWMLAAEIASGVANSKAAPGSQAAKYLRLLTERVNMIKKNHMGRIRETAVEMSHRIMDGGRWFTRSPEHPGIASEVHGVGFRTDDSQLG